MRTGIGNWIDLMTSVITRFRYSQIVIAKSKSLLDMMYSVSEISDIVGIPNRTLRDWLNNGAPHERDGRNHIWINGQKFAHWINQHRKPIRKGIMPKTQAYCFRCKGPVEMVDPDIIPIKGKLINIRGTCTVCGCSINRGGRYD